MWIVELFTSADKIDILKVYAFTTAKEVAYVLDVKPSVVYNYYLSLIRPRGNLKYVNIYRKI